MLTVLAISIGVGPHKRVLPGEAWLRHGGHGGVPVEFDTSNPIQDPREHGTTAEGRPAMSGQPNKARSSAPAVLKNYCLQ